MGGLRSYQLAVAGLDGGQCESAADGRQDFRDVVRSTAGSGSVSPITRPGKSKGLCEHGVEKSVFASQLGAFNAENLRARGGR